MLKTREKKFLLLSRSVLIFQQVRKKKKTRNYTTIFDFRRFLNSAERLLTIAVYRFTREIIQRRCFCLVCYLYEPVLSLNLPNAYPFYSQFVNTTLDEVSLARKFSCTFLPTNPTSFWWEFVYHRSRSCTPPKKCCTWICRTDTTRCIVCLGWNRTIRLSWKALWQRAEESLRFICWNFLVFGKKNMEKIRCIYFYNDVESKTNP